MADERNRFKTHQEVIGSIFFVESHGGYIEDALVLFHNSETFEKLCQRKTDLYIVSPSFFYDIFQEELKHGTIRGLTE